MLRDAEGDYACGVNFATMFRRIWAYIASITFRSLEGFARYLGTGTALNILQIAIEPLTECKVFINMTLPVTCNSHGPLLSQYLKHELPKKTIQERTFHL